jgi:hypothetical protein
MHRYDRQFVYKLTFPDGMVYIGSTHSVKERWANDGAHYKGQCVYDLILQYGWKNIKKEVILRLPQSITNHEVICNVEAELIRAYGDRAVNEIGNKTYHDELTAKQIAHGRYKKTVFWEIDGVVKSASEWCNEHGASYVRTKKIIDHYGITPKQALKLPPVPKNMNRRSVEYWESLGYHYFDEYKNSCRALNGERL